MLKYLTFTAIILVGGIYFLELYPVAVVDGNAISKRAWREAYSASLYRANSEKIAAVAEAEIKRDALMFLIENAIVKKQGNELLDNFTSRAKERLADAIQDKTDLKRASKLLYGLNYDKFEKLVLLPQARTDLLTEELEKRGEKFEIWLGESLLSAKIKLFFVPFEWTGLGVE